MRALGLYLILLSFSAIAAPTPEELLKSQRVLGVSADATEAEIKGAFRSKTLLLHPDRTNGATADEYREVSIAYDLLLADLHRKKKQSPDKSESDLLITKYQIGHLVALGSSMIPQYLQYGREIKEDLELQHKTELQAHVDRLVQSDFDRILLGIFLIELREAPASPLTRSLIDTLVHDSGPQHKKHLTLHFFTLDHPHQWDYEREYTRFLESLTTINDMNLAISAPRIHLGDLHREGLRSFLKVQIEARSEPLLSSLTLRLAQDAKSNEDADLLREVLLQRPEFLSRYPWTLIFTFGGNAALRAYPDLFEIAYRSTPSVTFFKTFTSGFKRNLGVDKSILLIEIFLLRNDVSFLEKLAGNDWNDKSRKRSLTREFEPLQEIAAKALEILDVTERGKFIRESVSSEAIRYFDQLTSPEKGTLSSALCGLRLQ